MFRQTCTGLDLLRRYRAAKRDAAISSGGKSFYTLDSVSGLHVRTDYSGANEQLRRDAQEEVVDVIMWLWDREPYDGKRKHDVASIRGVTISGYISAARKQLELRTGERLIYTVLSKELVRRLKALPSPVRFKEPIPLSVVLALLNDTDISIGIRAAVALAWFLI